ncbi:PD-(D/E)XK nuclease superfamily protein [Meinhardsimonia xiamenensis]|jgi:hypothetical protein|uniref:PD-(D/E)XK nuclease superfamily protein n=1 Tax=Meinhardsimonia xiamenensis TaxID=990712 RepID=A0A1G9E1R6_9RHOB|nr:ATP-binding protein [Meinhardsimonia xiamenensis]PRX33960.1 PD-(D/E)XK nuclease superfamily protein [Meinhardsimonia xiamenensis]SDK70053.1 PD-(D/E)XK nuclease superfamily protein [Meinhardsimonia xiamenensis]
MHASNDDRFQFRVQLSIFDHLSDGLYSNVAAVLTEAVANAWDADASQVSIYICGENGLADNFRDAQKLVIEDDGHGMDREAVQDRFLTIGYQRRNEGDRTPGGRKVMGRKGLGKLSLMSIADQIRIATRREGSAPVGFLMNVAEIRRTARKGAEVPEFELPAEPAEDAPTPHGTRLILQGLRAHRVRATGIDNIRRALARRFAVLFGSDFSVLVNGQKIDQSDRKDLEDIEFLWKTEGVEVPLPAAAASLETFAFPGREEDWPNDWKVEGWIATTRRPIGGEANALPIFARGRIAAENVLPKVKGKQHFYSYVTGQIAADFLDLDDKPDIILSDRQRLLEDDERVAKLQEFLRKQLGRMEAEWKRLRSANKHEDRLRRYPKLREWLDGLPEGWRDKAANLLRTIAELEAEDALPVKDEKPLLRAAVMGFERIRLNGREDELREAAERSDPEAVIRILTNYDELEVAAYRDIVRGRIQAVKDLQKLLEDHSTLEKVFQKHLFDHLWLLDPSWDHATDDEVMERQLWTLGGDAFADDEATKDKFKRVDIRLRRAGGGYVLVELKRHTARPKATELYEQCESYKEYLDAATRERHTIVVVVGQGMPEKDREKAEKLMRTVEPSAVVVTYEHLLDKANRAYSEFMEKTNKLATLDRLFDEEIEIGETHAEDGTIDA